MSTSLTNNDGNTKPGIRSKSNNCSNVNKNDIEVIMPPLELQLFQKKRKNTSMIWDHFTKCFEYSDDDDPHAKCNYCDMEYVCHPRRNGNSTMRMHLKHYCKTILINLKAIKYDIAQTKLVNYKIFTIKNTRRLIAEMIIIDELSFRFVENEGFKRFVEGTLMFVELRFVFPSQTTISRDILGIYASLEEQLKDIFVNEGYRVSLTTDTWTSIQNVNYMVLIAHFVDRNWKLHKRIINFSQIENHKGETIGKEVEKCLKH